MNFFKNNFSLSSILKQDTNKEQEQTNPLAPASKPKSLDEMKNQILQNNANKKVVEPNQNNPAQLEKQQLNDKINKVPVSQMSAAPKYKVERKETIFNPFDPYANKRKNNYSIEVNGKKFFYSYDKEKNSIDNESIFGSNDKDNNSLRQEVEALSSLEAQKLNEYKNAKHRNPVEASDLEKELNSIKVLKSQKEELIKGNDWWAKRAEKDRRAEELNEQIKKMGASYDPVNNEEHKKIQEEFREMTDDYNGPDEYLRALKNPNAAQGPKQDFTKEIRQEGQTANLDNGISDNNKGTEISEGSKKQDDNSSLSDEQVKTYKEQFENNQISEDQYNQILNKYNGNDPDIIKDKEYANQKQGNQEKPNEQKQSNNISMNDSQKLHSIGIDKVIKSFNSAQSSQEKRQIYNALAEELEKVGVSKEAREIVLNRFTKARKEKQDVQMNAVQSGKEKALELTQKYINGETDNSGEAFQKNQEKLNQFRKEGYNIDNSVVDTLSALGLNNSFDVRKKMFEKMTGSKDFKGTAEQNLYLKYMAERLSDEDLQDILLDNEPLTM